MIRNYLYRVDIFMLIAASLTANKPEEQAHAIVQQVRLLPREQQIEVQDAVTREYMLRSYNQGLTVALASLNPPVQHALVSVVEPVGEILTGNPIDQMPDLTQTIDPIAFWIPDQLTLTDLVRDLYPRERTGLRMVIGEELRSRRLERMIQQSRQKEIIRKQQAFQKLFRQGETTSECLAIQNMQDVKKFVQDLYNAVIIQQPRINLSALEKSYNPKLIWLKVRLCEVLKSDCFEDTEQYKQYFMDDGSLNSDALCTTLEKIVKYLRDQMITGWPTGAQKMYKNFIVRVYCLLQPRYRYSYIRDIC